MVASSLARRDELAGWLGGEDSACTHARLGLDTSLWDRRWIFWAGFGGDSVSCGS